MTRSFKFARAITLSLTVLTLSLTFQINGVQAAQGTSGQSPDGSSSAIQSFTLKNGLQVVVIPDHRLPVVTHMIWYKVGAADEQAGSSGLAHFVEHLMFKSCNAVHRETFSQVISRLGGVDNATTNHDATYYYQRVAKSQLANVMQLEAGRMAGLQLKLKDTNSEREVIQEERRSNIESDPIKLLNEQMMASLYQNHRYGIPVLGWAHEMPTLSREQAIAFYREHYGPNNAVLVVSGDVTGEQVRTLASKIYGSVTSNPGILDRVRPTEPPSLAARRINLVDRRAARPTIFRFYLVPGYASAEPGEAEALDLLISILGGGETSRLQQHLVTTRNIAAATGMRYYNDQRDSGRLAIFVVAQPKSSILEIETQIDNVLQKVVEDGVTSDELSRAKSKFEVRAIFNADNQLKRSLNIGKALMAGRSLEDVNSWPDRIQAVSLAQIKAVAKKYLQKRLSVTGVLMADKDRSSP